VATLPIQVRIRNEFGELPSKVIQDFANMKVSKRLAAGAMGTTTQTLLRLCRQYGIEFCTRKELVEQCKPHGHGWIKGKKRPWTPKPWKRKPKKIALL
jgi:hypothetical protein